MAVPRPTLFALPLLPAAVCASLLLAGAARAETAEAEAGAEGPALYQDFCAACHGEAGLGTPSGPPLARSSRLQDIDTVVAQTLKGGEYMPGFAFLLSDAEVSSVLTFIRTAWGNDFGPIDGAHVEGLR